VKLKVSVVVAIATGVLTVLTYFVPGAPLESLRFTLLRWGAIVGTLALFLGVGNLLQVHVRKIREQKPGHLYSIFLLIALFAVFTVVALLGPSDPSSLWIVSEIQRPLEVGMMALLATILLLAGVRVLVRRPTLATLVFFITAVVVLLGTTPLPFVSLPFLEGLRNWVAQVPAVGGARGLLLGMALGAAAAGLRVLLGYDQPYQR